jgi:hypothetical protein
MIVKLPKKKPPLQQFLTDRRTCIEQRGKCNKHNVRTLRCTAPKVALYNQTWFTELTQELTQSDCEMQWISQDNGIINLLKPTGYGMHQQVDTLCPHFIYVFCVCLRTISDLCHLHKKLIGFYNRDEKCLQRGTD